NAAECVRRVRFVISSVPLPALSLAQAPAVPLIPLSDFARPPLNADKSGSAGDENAHELVSRFRWRQVSALRVFR
ncbi:hypothetical protein, partial [Paraburkholderia ferrariae]